jgi:hypothetical protein
MIRTTFDLTYTDCNEITRNVTIVGTISGSYESATHDSPAESPEIDIIQVLDKENGKDILPSISRDDFDYILEQFELDNLPEELT